MEKPLLKHVDASEILVIINQTIAHNNLRLRTDMGRDNNQFVAGETEGVILPLVAADIMIEL